MHPEPAHPSAPGPENSGSGPRTPWFRGLSGYQWFVFVVAALGWLFDTMDQQLFNLARKPAVTQLLRGSDVDREVRAAVEAQTPPTQRSPEETEAAYKKAYGSKVDEFGGYATTIFMIGWALGGVAFGILGDKIGRARTMLITVLTYSVFTGLSAISRGMVDFCFYRFLTGLGVGGQFAVGVAMVAEVMPDRSRPHALGWLQALSAVGNMMAASTNLFLGMLEQRGVLSGAWKAMFLIGLAPAALAIPIMLRLREPERWRAAKAAGKAADGSTPKLGSIRELFGDPRWRRHTIVGMLLAFAGVVGLWGIGFFSFDLGRTVFRKHFEAQGLLPEVVEGKLTFWSGIMSLVQNAGGFLGVYAFAVVTQRIGRKPAFAISFVIAGLATAATFALLREFWHVFVLIPIMGFCLMTLFGGYAIYFAELYPTRLRSTGVSFCYNVGRLVAAAGPTALGLLTARVFADHPEPMRPAGIAMCSVFLIGLLALPFAPETKGKPLPE